MAAFSFTKTTIRMSHSFTIPSNPEEVDHGIRKGKEISLIMTLCSHDYHSQEFKQCNGIFYDFPRLIHAFYPD